MCGIVGVVDLRGASRLPKDHDFDRMVDALARRGPDGRGVWRGPHALLGHRRLSIIDPTTASSQPMTKDGVAIVFNGEIYNFRELRRELSVAGHAFRTAGDTEVLLEAWRAWGPRCVERLNGIFAFVIIDDREVFVARDHFGVKPLFYRLQDGVLWFGSELKAILADPRVPRAPSPEALDCFLTHAWIPAPLTAFQGIAQLLPATTMAFTIGDERPRTRVYWGPTTAERRISLEDAAEELDARLNEAVAMQMVSDVPLGAFLSGGLDSSSVVHAMRRTGADVRTFSLGFTEGSFDESDDAASTAALLGARHTAERISLDIEEVIKDVAGTNDDLLADASLLAVDRLCAMTRRHVTVALSGDGADEILAGYPTYAATYLARAWRLVPPRLRSLAGVAGERLPVSTDRYNLRDFTLRFLRGAERAVERPGADFAAWRVYFDDGLRRQIVRPAYRADGDAIGRYARAVVDAPGETLLKKLLVADLTHYLPSDMLVKVDRASMRHGLEVRVPFLDPRFVDFALSLPSTVLLSPTGKTKRVLRRHVERHVSPRIARGKKRGFNVPVGAALRGPLARFFVDTVSAEPFRSDGPLDVGVLLRLHDEHVRGRADHGYPLYAALVLSLWWSRFVT